MRKTPIQSRLRERNAFTRQPLDFQTYGPSSFNDVGRVRNILSKSTITASLFSRIAIDASGSKMKHVRIEQGTDNEYDIFSGLNNCLTTEANIDQSAITFMHEMVYSILDEGVIAVVPVDTTQDVTKTDGYDIQTMRVGKITQWYPRHVRIELYNDMTGMRQEIVMLKSTVAIIENPLYEVVNSRNGTLDRLRNKMELLDREDNNRSSNRLDLIFQLKYAVKTDIQRKEAEEKIKNLQDQLNNNSIGAAYIDAVEDFKQLSRPVNDGLQEQVSTLTVQFFNQLGITTNILDGTANESETRGYYVRTIDPILERIALEFERKFLSKTARTQGQKVITYRDPFKLVPIDQIADVTDTFRRNAVATSNEMRKVVGLRPDSAPEADILFNPNLTADNQMMAQPGEPPMPV